MVVFSTSLLHNCITTQAAQLAKHWRKLKWWSMECNERCGVTHNAISEITLPNFSAAKTLTTWFTIDATVKALTLVKMSNTDFSNVWLMRWQGRSCEQTTACQCHNKNQCFGLLQIVVTLFLVALACSCLSQTATFACNAMCETIVSCAIDMILFLVVDLQLALCNLSSYLMLSWSCRCVQWMFCLSLITEHVTIDLQIF